MKRYQNIRGVSLIEVLIALVIIMGTFFISSQALSSSRRQTNSIRNRQLATSYAAELVETFRSMKAIELAKYMKTNPFNPAMPPYRLCAHINLMDRQHNISPPFIINIDPNVALGTSALDLNPTNQTSNRFYMVQVVDVSVTPPSIIIAHCDKTVTDVAPGVGQYQPGAPNERFMVTVGVSWLPSSASSLSQIQRVAFTEVLPN